jgi:hypothetical protein
VTTVDENLNNPDCKFVFSLSPVPLTSTLEPRAVMEADCLSKATLRVAVDQLVTSTPGCLYWPAFEIVPIFQTCTGMKTAPLITHRNGSFRPLWDISSGFICVG